MKAMRFNGVILTALFVLPSALMAWPSAAGAEGEDERLAEETILLSGGLELEIVRIPAGSFLMGQQGEEGPVHRVTLTKDFWLSKYEITQAQWQAVMGANPAHFKGDDRRPVEQVSWDKVQTFIGKLNEAHPGKTFRLPTEAEWEYACRAGSTAVYSFGNDTQRLGEYAWYMGNSGSTTHSVGQKSPNAWGLYDMHGNVLEWVADRFGPYSAEAQTDPTGPTSGALHAMRGASWCDSAFNCRTAARYNGNGLPAFTSSDMALGFRLAR